MALKRTTTLKSRKPINRSNSSLNSKGVGLKKGKSLRARKKTVEEQEIARMTREADRRLCIELWSKRGNRSEVSGERLPVDPNWACVHHCWPKSKYPIYRYHHENCVLLTIEEHARVENGYKYEEVERRKEEFKIKHDI